MKASKYITITSVMYVIRNQKAEILISASRKRRLEKFTPLIYQNKRSFILPHPILLPNLITLKQN